MSLAYWTNP